ncbi:MAG: 2-oxoglutaramate amidase [Opitutia bacterium UBA7350]|nr:MAG: 2-oxoglutaramate amidase [Opitutae bacterium UBA7350]
MRIALSQFSPVLGNVESNLKTIYDFAQNAKEANAELLCLPELCTTGFSYDKIECLKTMIVSSLETIKKISKQYNIAICGSFLCNNKHGNFTNTFLYFDANGYIIGRYNKIHLFKPMGEDRYFEAGNDIITFRDGNTHIGCSICYDLRFPELFRKCASAGAQLQILAAAFPFPRLSHWRTLLKARAMENQNFIIATNQCGHACVVSEETDFCGHSMIVHPSGEILYEAGEVPEFFCFDIKLSDIQDVRNDMDCLRDLRSELY